MNNNNNGKSNLLKGKGQEIKVNRKTTNNNNYINQVPLSQNYYHYYQQKSNKLNKEENKNIKYQEYLGVNNYGINNVFTEYDSSPKYSPYPSNPLKLNNLSPLDFKIMNNNTNGKLNKQKNLNLKNKNKLNINNNDRALFKNFTNRELGKIHKLANKGNKKLNTFHNSSNSLTINPKNFLNQKYISKKGNDILYPVNIMKNQITKNKNHSIKNNSKELLNINLTQKKVNKNENMRKFNIISPPTDHNSNNKKNIKQMKNILPINKRKNNDILSPEFINTNHISKIKINKSNQNYKQEISTINTYNSCHNFYQKSNNNLMKKNNMDMLNTINNFEYNSNSLGENIDEINSINNNIIDNKDIYQNENELNYKNMILLSKGKNKNKVHKKGKLSENNLNLYNNRINNILNSNTNQIINYKKKLIQEFCHSLEEFIFMNVKNNFDTFIERLKNYNKDKCFNNLLLKRLQNKSIQKNFYREKSSSYKYLEPDMTNAHYSSIIMMNNSNIINVQRKEDYIDNDFSKEYYGRKTLYNFENNQSPPLTEKVDRIQRNFRPGKSHDPLKMNNIDNYNIYSNNTYFHGNNILENYTSFNNYNPDYNRRNDINNEYTNNNEERKTISKYDTHFNDINLYIPKKLKKIIKGNNRILSKSKEHQRELIDDLDISNPYISKIKTKKIISKKLSPQNEINKSHDNNELIKSKIKNNLNINYLRKFNINQNNFFQDISCDTNPNFYIKKENDNLLNKTNEIIIKRNNTQLTSGNTYDFKTNDNIPIYKKKIKITKGKGKVKIYINKGVPNNIRNKMINLNGNNKTAEQFLSPNFDKNDSKNTNAIENIEKFMNLNMSNSKNINNLRNSYTEPRREINNNLKEIQQIHKFNKIQELTVNLSKKENNLQSNINSQNIINTNNNNENKIYEKLENNHFNNQNDDNNNNLVKNEIENINQNENQNDDKDNNKETITIEENVNNKNESTIGNEINNTETITNNNDNNSMSNDNNIINDDTDESDDNVTKEIIVKDVSTKDKRLNVFIKYVELSQFNTLNNEFNNANSINLFQTDSLFYPPLYPKQNINYYYNYYYGNKSDKYNKLKLHKILSSIIEEEEKSKAAGSINNSYLSDEELSKKGNNYTHFFIQSIKYVSNFLQSIFDDKKKDMYFQFMKVLKKIKNEAFLRGLINQKKFQDLSKVKGEEKDNTIDNNNSSEVIIYGSYDKDNTNNSISKSKEIIEKDISENKSNVNSNKNLNDEKLKTINCNNSPRILSKKYSFDKNLSLIGEKYFNENILKKNKSCYPFDIFDLKENDCFSSIDLNSEIKENKNLKTIIDTNKLKIIIEYLEESKNIKLIDKFFNTWKKFKVEENEKSYEDKKDDNEIQIDYEKSVTVSEACRGLSDVILDFKIYLIKYSLKNKKEKNYE